MQNANLLPRELTSIASVAALLADVKLFEYLPDGVEYMSDERPAQAFSPGLAFRLGWNEVRTRAGEVADRLMIYVVAPGRDEEEWRCLVKMLLAM